MNQDQKQIIRETCKSHSTKVSDREFARAHPTKLSKQELEDLYYAILDNNLELKQTINTQNEKIKQLSTKVQRLASLQKSGLGRNEKDCCINAKALIKEQKDIIAEQKRANDRLSEKNRVLTMRLCSAKQFLGKNSARCNKCCLAAAMSLNFGPLTRSWVTRPEDGLPTGPKLVGAVTGRSHELCKIHSDYLSRVSRLEQEVVVLRQEEAGKKLMLQQSEAQSGQLLQRLRAAENQCGRL
ncbi:hypothetical protein RR48_03152 [Papilio machaon]|uniref:Uncharacterized protein n=1 Tax=Papilio machaon TaxID=76193 RepID=A0A0N1IF65_PAPMA|nr:hypothetical protein RR48_03152 [Papilio machaon]